MLDAESKAAIEEIEQTSRFPTGIGRIERGECPCGAVTPVACSLCPTGHQLECHYPLTCEEAHCSHFMASQYVDG